MSIKEMGGKADAKREAGIIKVMTRSTGRTRNATSVFKKYIRSLIAQRIKKINTMMKRAQGVPVAELS